MSTLVFSDNFNRADAGPGAVANGWIDPGTDWAIASNVLNSVENNPPYVIYRPASEAGTSHAMVWRQAAGTYDFRLHWVDANHYIRVLNNSAGAALIELWIGGSLSATLVNIGYPAITGDCILIAAITDHGGGNCDVYLDVRAASSASVIVKAGAAVGVTATGVASVAGSPAVVPRAFPDPIYLFANWTYTGVITAGGSPAATALPSFGSDLGAPALAPSIDGGGNSLTGAGGAVLTPTAASGTSTPITHDLLSSDVVGTAPSDMTVLRSNVSTSGNLTDATIAAGAIRTYALRATDSFDPPAVSYSAVAVIQRPANPDMILFEIGDSTLVQGGAPPTGTNTYVSVMGEQIGRQFAYAGGGRRVITLNQGVSGSTSGDWIGGSANLNAALAALATAALANPTALILASVGLGINDSRNSAGGTSQAQYQANIASLMAAVLAVHTSTKFMLSDPIFCPDGKGGGVSYLNHPYHLIYYPAALDALAALHPTYVIRGVKGQALVTGNTNGYPQVDGVHPNLTGGEIEGSLYTAAYEAAINPSSGGSPATGYTATLGASTCPTGEAVRIFVALAGGTTLTTSLVVSVADSLASTIAGTITIAPGAVAGSTTVTPTAAGSHALTFTHTGGNGGMSDPGSATLAATSTTTPGAPPVGGPDPAMTLTTN